MGHIFASLADEIMQSPWANKDTQLTQKLHETLEHVVVLTGGTASSTRDYKPPVHSSSASSPQSSTWSPPKAKKTPNASKLYPESFDNLTLLSTEVDQIDVFESGTKVIALDPLDHQSFDETASAHGYPGPLSNVFGSGWTGHRPFSYTFNRAAGVESQFGADSMSVKIVRCTLQRAYIALLNGTDLSQGVAGKKFGLAVKFQSRDQLLYGLNWFLGPGYPEMRRLAGATFYNFNKPPIGISDHHWVAAHDELKDGVMADGENQSCIQPFYNADDIVLYLESKGLRQINEDILELIKVYPNPEPHADNPFLNLDLFFPPVSPSSMSSRGSRSTSPRKRGIRISFSRLLNNLSDVSICLTYGPGYPAKDLDKAICASVIDSSLY